MSGKNRRDKTVLFRVSPEEYDLMQQKAELSGIVSLSAYIRKMTVDGYVIKLELPEMPEMISLLRRSSNNLNQVAVTSTRGSSRDRCAGKQSRSICFAANAPVCLYGEFTMMEIYTVSFFGHRQLDDFMGTERRLGKLIRELLIEREYVTRYASGDNAHYSHAHQQGKDAGTVPI